MLVRHGESGSNRAKALIHDDKGIDSTVLEKQLEISETGFKPTYLTKRARLQAFNHGFQVIPEYLIKKAGIKNVDKIYSRTNLKMNVKQF